MAKKRKKRKAAKTTKTTVSNSTKQNNSKNNARPPKAAQRGSNTYRNGKQGQSSTPKQTPPKSAQNKPKVNSKEGVIHRLLVVLGLVGDKKQKKEEKYAQYNIGQIRPINNDETRGHNGYLITKSGSGENAEFGYVSITHKELTDGKKNIRLLQNPNPSDTKKSHAVNEAKYASAKDIGKHKNNWRLNKKDKKMLKGIFNKKKKK